MIRLTQYMIILPTRVLSHLRQAVTWDVMAWGTILV